MKHKRTFLNGDKLKIIAIVTMLIDHIGAALVEPVLYSGSMDLSYHWYEADTILRTIGRTAFPIFAFLLVEGFYHTRNRKKYLGRLLLFTLVSEIPFDLAFYGELFYRGSQNVFWTLSMGFLVIWGTEELYKRCETGWKSVKKRTSGNGCGGMTGGGKAYHRIAAGFLSVILILAGCFAAVSLQTDYNGYGVLLIALFYFGKRAGAPMLLVCAAGYLLFLWEPACLIGFVLILFYNGTRKQRGKGFRYFFYLFYPVHLLIFGWIRVVFLVN